MDRMRRLWDSYSKIQGGIAKPRLEFADRDINTLFGINTELARREQNPHNLGEAKRQDASAGSLASTIDATSSMASNR